MRMCVPGRSNTVVKHCSVFAHDVEVKKNRFASMFMRIMFLRL